MTASVDATFQVESQVRPKEETITVDEMSEKQATMPGIFSEGFEVVPQKCESFVCSIDDVLATCCHSLDVSHGIAASGTAAGVNVVQKSSSVTVMSWNQIANTSSEPYFQKRGRFLVWPASFGSDFKATIASRT